MRIIHKRKKDGFLFEQVAYSETTITLADIDYSSHTYCMCQYEHLFSHDDTDTIMILEHDLYQKYCTLYTMYKDLLTRFTQGDVYYCMQYYVKDICEQDYQQVYQRLYHNNILQIG